MNHYHVIFKRPKLQDEHYKGPDDFQTVHYFVICGSESRAIEIVKSEQTVGYGGLEQYTVKKATRCGNFASETGSDDSLFQIS